MALRTDDENILQEKRRLMLNQTEVQDNASGDKAGGEGIYSHDLQSRQDSNVMLNWSDDGGMGPQAYRSNSMHPQGYDEQIGDGRRAHGQLLGQSYNPMARKYTGP